MEDEALWPAGSWKCKRCRWINRPEVEICMHWFKPAADGRDTEGGFGGKPEICYGHKSVTFAGYVNAEEIPLSTREKQELHHTGYRG